MYIFLKLQKQILDMRIFYKLLRKTDFFLMNTSDSSEFRKVKFLFRTYTLQNNV